ncbi:Kelch repeat and BTB domain-containing protein 7 [Merluccius polli]|uniref:Kelch repeat and BTB domain-containing protein 7 n=1 Tax=Merluccius polli TaxID=89951 RepID=A0AA47MCK6_MERPO|nr:Kelch repeat and BTB domain-containing protein 7 [Merluccius polli]
MASSVLSYFSGPEELEDQDHARGLLRELKSLYDSRLLADVVIGVQQGGDGATPLLGDHHHHHDGPPLLDHHSDGSPLDDHRDRSPLLDHHRDGSPLLDHHRDGPPLLPDDHHHHCDGSSPPVGTTSKGDPVERLFRCNRNVLAAASPYFRSMFTGGLNESSCTTTTTRSRVVLIRGVDAESMAAIIDYCYTGRVTLTEGNVQRVYAAADLLQLDYVRRVCAGFMARRLDLSNCVAVLHFADAFANPDLKEKARAFIARNFNHLFGGDQLCDLDLAHVQEILGLDSLDVDCERKVCAAALRWVEANAPMETDEALRVLRCVRWRLLDREACLEGLAAGPVAAKYLAHFVNRSEEEEDPKAETPKRRLGASAKEMLLFFGLPSERITCCDPYSLDLYFMAPPPLTSDLSGGGGGDYKRSAAATESLVACAAPDDDGGGGDHCLYLASHRSRRFWLYDPLRNSWQELARRPLARVRSMGMGYLDGHVYVLGGRSAATDARLREVECYSVRRDQWTLVAPLPHAPGGSGGRTRVVPLRGHLYAVSRRRVLCYDPRRDRWRHCGSPPPPPAQLHGACAYRDRVVCVGVGACDTPVVRAYSPARGEWQRLGDVPAADCRALGYQVVQHGGRLLLLTQTPLPPPQHQQQRQHSNNSNRYRTLVHEYEPARDAWRDVAAVHVCAPGPVCVAARLYPPCLGAARGAAMEREEEEEEEEDDSGSSADWDLDGLTDAESDSASSSSFSDENW